MTLQKCIRASSSTAGHFALLAALPIGWYSLVAEPFRKILGIRFYTSDLAGLLSRIPGAGLVAVPSAPVLTRMPEDAAHREALEGCDFAITDSSFMVLLWLLRSGERLERISGLRFLRGLFCSGSYRAKGDTFWIMPSEDDRSANLAYLRSQGFDIDESDTYLAPLYARGGPLSDGALLQALAGRSPKLVVIALAGGVQERLGWYLRQNLGYRPAILCIGGAIAFLSGRQTAIPVWADRMGLGWLLRLLTAPGSSAKKMKGVWRLPALVWKYGEKPVH
jgi:UDP-N-acetyl-D-mannosaminuronic acid transferase (WecB/TagA/CpsF family)